MSRSRPIRRLGVALALALALATTIPSLAAAAWQVDGNPVCTADGAQSGARVVSDAAAGMIVTWIDARPGAPGIYAQRLLSNGAIAPGWPVNGVLCSSLSPTWTPAPVADGVGGVMVVWLSGETIYAQRIDANGAIHAGWPASGKVVIAPDATMADGFAAVTDGVGGAYITRGQLQMSPARQYLRLTRITSDGTIATGWTAAGVVVIDAPEVSLFGLEPDPAGGVICAAGGTLDNYPSYHYGTIQRFGPDASLALFASCPQYLSGNAAPGGILYAAAAPDGAGGLYGAWFDVNDAASISGHFGQHVTSSGQGQWAEPYPLAPHDRVFRDEAVGAWFTGGSAGIVVHRRLADGSLPPGWTSSGVAITTGLGTYSCVPVLGQLVVGWTEDSGGPSGLDIRALSVLQNGVIPAHWAPGGSPVCAAPGNQQFPFLISDGAFAVLACWQDRRPGASVSDIYANRIPLPVQAGIDPPPPYVGPLRASPNPARDRIELAFALNGDQPGTLELLDVTGRAVRQVTVLRGTGTAMTMDLGGLANGIYFVRLVHGRRVETTRFAIVQ